MIRAWHGFVWPCFSEDLKLYRKISGLKPCICDAGVQPARRKAVEKSEILTKINNIPAIGGYG